jgi:hypothetical protein
MKQKVTALALSLKERAIYFILAPFLTFIGLAFLFQVFFVILQFSGNENLATQIANEITWRIDGTFKNNPNNIWYQEEEHIWVESVENQVKIGKLAGNRNLAFGVKNILEEYLQETGYDLAKDAPYKLKVNIVYLDVLSTKTNISVFHKGEDETVVRLQGILYKEGKKIKEVVVEEGSSEISMSTLIVDEGGKFNQTSLSNALKKASDSLIKKLFGKNAK